MNFIVAGSLWQKVITNMEAWEIQGK